MKKLFLFILIFLNITLNAQKTTSSILYELNHQTDSLNKSKIKNEKFRIIFNQQVCLYKSVTQEIYDSIAPIIGKQKEIQFNETGKFDMTGMPQKGNTTQYFTDLKTKKTFMKVVLNKFDYLVEEQDVINWKIFDETKIIMEKKCQKAVCNFKGRNYIAWFTNEIPASVGPWKLNGLPGAILEVNDDKNEVSFVAYKFILNKKDIIVSIPNNIEKISKKEFKQVEKALKDNPSLSNSGIKLTKVGGNNNKRTFNNPIELKD